MTDAARVEKLEAVGNVPDDAARLVLGEVVALLNLRQQLPALDLLEDQVEAVRLLVVVHKLDDVLVAAALQEDLNLIEDARPRVAPFVLLDHLHRVALRVVQVEAAALEHRGVGALAQHRPAQTVRPGEGARVEAALVGAVGGAAAIAGLLATHPTVTLLALLLHPLQHLLGNGNGSTDDLALLRRRSQHPSLHQVVQQDITAAVAVGLLVVLVVLIIAQVVRAVVPVMVALAVVVIIRLRVLLLLFGGLAVKVGHAADHTLSQCLSRYHISTGKPVVLLLLVLV
ncbi:hypothetical protein TYRP_008264 [Tyrophagus putrescentiae]|nr:hypothetical protein TYRP_008264 [Tyrophagus putrescentiae]